MKRIVTLFVTTIAGATFVAAGCGNGSLLAPNGSGSAEPGTLALSAIHHLSDDTALEPDADGFKTLTNDEGFTITVEEAHLGWKNLTLVSGGDDPECEAGHDQTVSLAKEENLLAEDLIASDLGDAAIPMIAYCRYRIVLGPSAAAAGLVVKGTKNHTAGETGTDGTALSDGSEATLHLAGSWTKGAASGTFHIESSNEVTVEGVFESEEGGAVIEHPLHFHEGETEVAVTFGTHYDELFDGIDFQIDTIDTQHDKAIDNLTAAVHQHGISHTD